MMYITEIRQGEELADRCRVIETLGNFPGQSLFLMFRLQVTCRKINPQCNLIVITACILLFNTLSQPVDPDHHLQFILHILREIRVKKRPVGRDKSRIGFQEEDGISGNFIIQFMCVSNVVPGYAYDLHYAISLWNPV